MPCRLRHAALELAPAAALAGARLNDRDRVGLLFQGAAVLAHLEAAGSRLEDGWEGAGIASGGELCGLAAAGGADEILPQRRLRELAEALFGSPHTVAGRGAPRRAVRALLGRWQQDLVAISPHRTVGQILDEAPFLWQPASAPHRAALVAELVGDAGQRALLAGSGPGGGWPPPRPGSDAADLRRRVTAADGPPFGDSPAVGGALSGAGGSPAEAAALAAAGRWRAALAAWRRRPPATEPEVLARAEALLAVGRFTAAADALAEVHADAEDAEIAARADALRLRCRLLLGEHRAVRRRLNQLARLNGAPLPTAVLPGLAEIAVRAFAGSRERTCAERWLARARKRCRGAARAEVDLAAAEAAWDRGDPEAMIPLLAASRPAIEASAEPRLERRWHQVAGLRAMAVDDGPAMVSHLTRALATDRRRLYRHEAAGLWSDLGVGRARAGDLAGAERAFLHAQRLHAGCDGPRGLTLALFNLAEIRLRRGRLRGVERVLERSLAVNRRDGNLRGEAHDLALWARFELVLGRPDAALAHCDAALDLLDRAGIDWHRAEIHLFRARSLGWAGEPEAAARALDRVTPEALGELEPEERPALFALAGLPDAALAAARGTGHDDLWSALLAGGEPPALLWQGLPALEPYRAARLVFDAEQVRPGAAPAELRRRAAEELRRVGADRLALRLELVGGGSWKALAAYLGDGAGELPALRRMFADAGYPEVRIERRNQDGEGPEILIGGPGGDAELTSAASRDGNGNGELVLRAERVDPPLAALFGVARLSLVGPPAGGSSSAAPLRGSPARGARVAGAASGILGEDPELLAAVSRTARLAAGDLPILILGESGTGKELLARLVHRRSPRSARPWVAINCAALGETLLLSDLFGHVRGSFTGADRDRAGVFETAEGGTVFLDEIGDLPPSAQGMLLRVLQEGEVRRVGESLPRTVDARVVAATHRDLAAMVAEGGFRQDLFFRLNGAKVTLPPLRERGRDVLALAEHFLGQTGAAPERLGPPARARLLAHSWPGNVRELENVIQLAVALAGDDPIAPEHLELPETGPLPGGDYHGQIEGFRRRLIEEALAVAGGNKAAAARRLGLSRQALSYLVRELRIG